MVSPQPVISILLPVWNAAPVLTECLESIVGQTFPDFEVIAVDDGSTDESRSLLAGFARKDPRFRVLHLPRKGGIVDALNTGLAACQGAYVARMDADDVMLPDRLDQQLRFARAHPHLDLIGTQIHLFRTDRDLTAGQRAYAAWSNDLVDDAAIREALFIESPIMHPTFFAAASFFRAMGGYRDRPWPEDYDLLLRAHGAGAAFGKVPKILLSKRDGPHRLYRTDPRGKPDGMFRAKAHFFASGPYLHGKSACFIAGTGSSGRTAARHLLSEGVAISGFLDHRDGPPGRTVMGCATTNWTKPAAVESLCRHQDAMFVVCIGHRPARRSFIHLLHHLHFNHGTHYVRFV